MSRRVKEALFNEVYDTEHVPYITSVPGVLEATRSTREPLTMMLAGEKRVMAPGNEPKYSVTYQLESPDVLPSDAWAEAGAGLHKYLAVYHLKNPDVARSDA